MVLVDSAVRLQELLEAPQAIAFIHFDWSGQSIRSLKVAEQLERILWTNARVYRVDPDVQADAARWLSSASERYQVEFSGGGLGALLWLKAGGVMDSARCAAGSGLEELMQTTLKAFP